MTPQMGEYTLQDDNAIMAAHTALPSAHHPAEVAEGRPSYGGVDLLVLPGVGCHGSTTSGRQNDRLFYEPMMVPTPITVRRLYLEVTVPAGAGNLAMLGIYSADINWQPVALQLASVAVPINGAAVVSGAYAVTLQPGRYLKAILPQATFTARVIQAPSPYQGYALTLGASPTHYSWRVGVAYGALPAVGIVWDTADFSAVAHYHCVFLDLSAP